MRFRRILAATDFSPASRPAVRAAAKLAASHRGVVWITHAVAPVYDAMGGLPRMYREMQSFVESEARRRLSRAVASVRKTGANVRPLELHGPAADAIRTAARVRRADLVVVGTHGRTGLPRLLLGSIASRIVATAPCPVLAVSRGRFSGRVQRIVFGTDFSDASRRAWATAVSLAKSQAARLRIVHAVAPLAMAQGAAWAYAEAESAFVADARRRLEGLRRAARRAGVRADAVVARGAAHEALVRESRGAKDVWIVVGTHGLTGARGALLGSVASRVVATAPCPVLTVRGRTRTR